MMRRRQGSRSAGVGGCDATKALIAPKLWVIVALLALMSATHEEAENRSRTVDVAPAISAAPNCINNPLARSEEHTSELQSLMRISYAVFCLTKNTKIKKIDDCQKADIINKK